MSSDSSSESSSSSRKHHKKRKRDERSGHKGHKEKRHRKEKKDAKEKKHHHHHHRRHHHHHHSRQKETEKEASCAPTEPASEPAEGESAWSAFANVIASNPSGRLELGELLKMLDDGGAVILEQIEDPALRERLRVAVEALRLEAQRMPDGSVAYAKADGAASLARRFAPLLAADHADAADADADAMAPPMPSQPPHGPSDAAPGRRAVIGPAAGPMPPPPPATDAGDESERGVESASHGIGPAAPPLDGAMGGSDAHGAEVDGPRGHARGAAPRAEPDSPDDEIVGPVLPSAGASAVDDEVGTGTGGGGGKLRWWERGAALPKPSAPIESGADDGDGAPMHRDDWMLSLPAERTDLNTVGQARQFLRNGRQERGDVSEWTDVPADRARKAAEAAMVVGGGGGGGVAAAAAASSSAAAPMTLAEAVALAKANAASGRRPRAQQRGGGGGSGSGEGGDEGGGLPAPESLVDMAARLADEAKAKGAGQKGKGDWEGQHPWKPWNRETDLDIRAVNPKGKETILNNQHMGTLGDRFGGGRKESTFM